MYLLTLVARRQSLSSWFTYLKYLDEDVVDDFDKLSTYLLGK